MAERQLLSLCVLKSILLKTMWPITASEIFYGTKRLQAQLGNNAALLLLFIFCWKTNETRWTGSNARIFVVLLLQQSDNSSCALLSLQTNTVSIFKLILYCVMVILMTMNADYTERYAVNTTWHEWLNSFVCCFSTAFWSIWRVDLCIVGNSRRCLCEKLLIMIESFLIRL